MIHQAAICWDCEQPIASVSDIVFAPPMCDHHDCSSACFHGICLMRWRERRNEARTRARAAAEGLARHLNGECSCQEPPKP